jgi:hypothetical protein
MMAMTAHINDSPATAPEATGTTYKSALFFEAQRQTMAIKAPKKKA